jgi:multidrug efflux system outer membrane protein
MRRRRATAVRVASSVVLSGLLTACALKDPPTTAEVVVEGMPGAVVPDVWQAAAGTGPVGEGWLREFGDTTLEALVADAIAYSPDLLIAAARVDQAAAALKAAGGKLLPAVDLLGRTGGKLGGDFTGTSGALLSAVWEADLWGRVRYARRATAENFYSTELDLLAARRSIAALVAKSWFLATESRLQHELSQRVVTESDRVVAVAEERFRVGVGSELDVTLARQSLAAARDTERELDLARREAVRAVETLVGRYPGARLDVAETLPVLADSVPAGVPSELLARRPDVAAALRRIAAAFADVEAAKAARLPTISLTAGLSHITSDLFVLEKRDDIVESVGATLYLPIFRGGALIAEVEARTAVQREALAGWAKTGLAAFAEAESALSQEASLLEREPILTARVTLGQRALALEQERYRIGTSDLRPLLQQQLALFAVQSALLRVQSERRVQRVNLHLALGGDFGLDHVVAAQAGR